MVSLLLLLVVRSVKTVSLQIKNTDQNLYHVSFHVHILKQLLEGTLILSNSKILLP